MEELNVVISKDGNIKMEVVGGTGQSCLKTTEEFEQNLGLVEERKHKSEFYEQEYNPSSVTQEN